MIEIKFKLHSSAGTVFENEIAEEILTIPEEDWLLMDEGEQSEFVKKLYSEFVSNNTYGEILLQGEKLWDNQGDLSNESF